MYRIFSILILTLILGLNAHAQQTRDHFSVGVGSALIYGDNSGNFRALKFKINPSFSFSYNKQLKQHFDLRSTIGGQFLNSGNYLSPNDPKVKQWGEQDQAYEFRGVAIFGDIMPTYQFNPNLPQRVGDVVHLYAGIGLGLMQVFRNQKVNTTVTPGIHKLEESRQTSTLAYIPIRVGVSSNLDFDWDYALEFSALTGTNSNIDGNNLKNKLIHPDILFQVQFMVKRYIGR